MGEFIGTMLMVTMLAVAAYYAGKASTKDELRMWQQRAISAEKIADDMGRAAMENYVDLAVAEIQAGK